VPVEVGLRARERELQTSAQSTREHDRREGACVSSKLRLIGASSCLREEQPALSLAEVLTHG
ncbi:MAG TPA: hypothetical protein VMF89_15880, partial [Polyangiales bacterium]|nr:hypothetical protein [Polyangiales bacterium]